MRHVRPRRLQIYHTPNGKRPFAEWLESIQDLRTQDKIDRRLERLANGNFGDCRSIGGGVSELRIHFGPGYRGYFGELDDTIVLLLCGGDKASQNRDIRRAKTYWLAYKETHQ